MTDSSSPSSSIHGPSVLPVNLCAPISCGIIYTLTYPTVTNEPLPLPSSAEEPAEETRWQIQLRELIKHATKEGAHCTHIIANGTDEVSSPIIAILQARFVQLGLDTARLFHSHGTPRAVLQQLLRVWQRRHTLAGEKEDDDGVDSDDEEESFQTPSVDSRAFRRSIRACMLPRILILAPSMNHRWNEQLHRQILALDINANLAVNEYHPHSFVSRKTVGYGDPNHPTAESLAAASAAAAEAASLAAATSSLAPAPPASAKRSSIVGLSGGRRSSMAPAAAIAAAPAPAQPTHAPAAPPQPVFLTNSPQILFDNSVFSVPLSSTPVLLEYAVYRPASTGVWTDLSRLQRCLEDSIAANGGVVLGPSYPSPITHDLNDVFVARHTRVFTRLSQHALRRILLVPGEVVLPDAETTRLAEHAIARRASSTMTPELLQLAKDAHASKAAMDTSNEERLRALFDGPFSTLRTRSAFSGPRLVWFDDSPAGHATVTLLRRLYPDLTFDAVHHSLAGHMSVYEHLTRAPPGSDILIIGSLVDLGPLASLILHDGRKTGILIDKHAIRDAFEQQRLMEIEQCQPELPSAIMNTHLIPHTLTEQLKFHATRIVTAHYVKLASLKG